MRREKGSDQSTLWVASRHKELDSPQLTNYREILGPQSIIPGFTSPFVSLPTFRTAHSPCGHPTAINRMAAASPNTSPLVDNGKIDVVWLKHDVRLHDHGPLSLLARDNASSRPCIILYLYEPDQVGFFWMSSSLFCSYLFQYVSHYR